MEHFMCDLETMGLSDNAAIVSIGIVEFDETQVGRMFYRNVSLENCLNLGLRADQSTIDWWAKQEQAAQDAWKKDPVLLAAALTELNRYLELGTGGLANVKFWGNGAGFDNVVLKNGYRALDADEPWKYYNNRCFRTMKAMFPLDEKHVPPRVGTYHNALDDALTQVHHLQAICKYYTMQLW